MRKNYTFVAKIANMRIFALAERLPTSAHKGKKLPTKTEAHFGQNRVNPYGEHDRKKTIFFNTPPNSTGANLCPKKIETLNHGFWEF